MPFGVEHLGVDAVDAREVEQAHPLDGDLALERPLEDAIDLLGREPPRRGHAHVEDDAAHGRERDDHADPEGLGHREDGAPSPPRDLGPGRLRRLASFDRRTHQKASPIPNESAAGTPKIVPGSPSSVLSASLAIWAPGIRKPMSMRTGPIGVS